MDEQGSAGERPQWEHYIEYMRAEAYTEGEKVIGGLFSEKRELIVKDFMLAYYPEQPVPLYAIEAVLPRINQLGDEGWEMVQMQPVHVAPTGDISTGGSLTNVYLCVFKRLKRSAGL